MDAITVSTAPEIQAKHTAHKRDVRLGKTAKKALGDSFAPPPLPSFSPAAAPPAEKKKSAYDSLLSSVAPQPYDDYNDYDEEPLDTNWEKEATEALKRRTTLAAKINDYYREFPATRPGGVDQKKPPVWSSADSEEKMKAEHERIRFIMDSTTSKQAVQRIFVQCMRVAETVTVPPELGGWGINPMDLNLAGIGTATEANIAQFEPELTEGAIELREWLSTSWEVRLAFKALSFAQAYSALTKNPQMMEQLRKAQEAARNNPPADKDL